MAIDFPSFMSYAAFTMCTIDEFCECFTLMQYTPYPIHMPIYSFPTCDDTSEVTVWLPGSDRAEAELGPKLLRPFHS